MDASEERARPILARRSALGRWPNPAAEDIAWLGLIPALAAMAAAFQWLAPWLAPGLLPDSHYPFFPERRFWVHPEPLEETRFLIAVAIPIALASVVLFMGSARPGRRQLDPPIIAFQLACLGFVVWAITKQTSDLLYLLPGYLDPLILSVPTLVAGAAIGLILTVLVLRDPHPEWPPRARALGERLGRRPLIPTAAAIVLTGFWLLPAVVTDTSIANQSLTEAHLPGFLEDYLAPVNGRTPLVDFVPQYASLLPLAASPLLAAFDSSITSFSLIQCALSLLALVCVYGAFVQVTDGRWRGLGLYLPFLAMSLFPWAETGLKRDFNGLYYVALPNRYLGPFVVLLLFARHLRRGSPPLWVAFFAAGLTLLNNFEFGASCLAALLAASVLAGDRSLPAMRRFGELLTHAAGGLVGALAVVCAVILIRSGELPDLSLLTYWSRIFGRHGFGLVPMPTWGLHWALYVTYVGALLTGAVRYARMERDRVLTAMLVFSGIFGLATGQYFAGWSVGTHLIVLFPIWALALSLLAWAAIPALRGANLRQVRRLIVPGFAVMAGFGVMVAAIARFPLPWQEVERLSTTGPAPYDVGSEQRFVERRTDAGDPVLILGHPFQHLIAERAGVDNVSPWRSGALMSYREVVDAIEKLDEEQGSKVFTGAGSSSVEEVLRWRGFALVAVDPASEMREWGRR